LQPNDSSPPPSGLRAEPANPAESEFAKEYRDLAAQCRQKFAEPSFDLPTLPASAMRVLSLVQDPDVSPRKIAQALQTDPVLIAKFLRLANSPFYMGARAVESVQAAIDRLGLYTVRSVVLTIALNSAVLREKRLGKSALAMWDHALNTAVAIQDLGMRLHMAHSVLFVLGLMHDIGKLPCWLMLYELTAKRPGMRPEFLQSLVEEVHMDVGEVLMDVWKMPLEVSVAVGGHHRISSIEEANYFVMRKYPNLGVSECNVLAIMLSCVSVADSALAALGLSDEANDLNLGRKGLFTDLGLSEEQVTEYLSSLPKHIKEHGLVDF